jgi:hypothetical protein
MSESGVGVPAEFEAIALKNLARFPADRFEDARELPTTLGSCPCASELE